jgi:hypothetical protein
MTATKAKFNLNLAWGRPLRERAREAIVAQWRADNPRPFSATASALRAAEHQMRNAEKYREMHCSGYDNIPGYWEWAETLSPNLGINNHEAMIYLVMRNQARRALAAAGGKEYEPTAAEIEEACEGWWPRRVESAPGAPRDGLGEPDGLEFVGETKKGFALFTDAEGRLLVRDSKGCLSGYSGALDCVSLS